VLDEYGASEEVRKRAAAIKDKLHTNRLAESKSSLPVYMADILEAYADCDEFIEEEHVARLIIASVFGLRCDEAENLHGGKLSKGTVNEVRMRKVEGGLELSFRNFTGKNKMGGITKVVGYFPPEIFWVLEMELELWKRADKGEIEKTFATLRLQERIRGEDRDFELDRTGVC
jgi:hypothetical protein